MVTSFGLATLLYLMYGWIAVTFGALVGIGIVASICDAEQATHSQVAIMKTLFTIASAGAITSIFLGISYVILKAYT